MLDKEQLKVQGLAFGRDFQMAYKSAVMYSVDHPAAERALQHCYTTLNTLVKQTRQFTFGFVNNRLLLNNLLTDNKTLNQLEAEFSKRHIATVTFEAGIGLRDFKRGLAIVAAKPREIEEKGGIGPFLAKNLVVGMRITPAQKSDTGDTTLEMDSGSYLLAQGMLEAGGASGPSSVDRLFQASSADDPAALGSPGELLSLAQQATQETLNNPEGNVGAPTMALAGLLERLAPDYLVSLLPEGRRAELEGRPPKEVAGEVVEDAALQWATQRLGSAPADAGGVAVEEEVVRALGRGLKATLVAERVVQKLSRFVEEAGLPPEVHDRIRQGLTWFTLGLPEKQARLVALEQFDDQHFRQLLNYVEDAMGAGHIPEVLQVAQHYFACLERSSGDAQARELARAPELLHRIAGLQTLDFLHKLARELCRKLPEQEPGSVFHQAVVACLQAITQSAGVYENYEFVQEIGEELEKSRARDEAQHAACCGAALNNLITPAAAERLVELFAEHHDDPGQTQTAVGLLKKLGERGAEAVFQGIEEEKVAAMRMRLLRLVEQLGPVGIEVARRRLQDERWYVVRNACRVLGGLEDPELCSDLHAALHHPDARVEEEALNIILKSHGPGSGEALAEALPDLQPALAERTLDELIMLRDASSIDGLENFLLQQKGRKTPLLEKVVQCLAAIPSEHALEALGKAMFDNDMPLPVRRAALRAVGRSSFARARQLLTEFSQKATGDPLAGECQRLLAAPHS